MLCDRDFRLLCLSLAVLAILSAVLFVVVWPGVVPGVSDAADTSLARGTHIDPNGFLLARGTHIDPNGLRLQMA